MHAQVGIGTETPHPSAELHLESNNKGFLLPRLSNAEMNAIQSPANGLLIYNTDEAQIYFFNEILAKWTPTNISTYTALSDADGDTKIVVDALGDGSENTIKMYADADGNSVQNGEADKVAELSFNGLNLQSELMTFSIDSISILSLLNENTIAGSHFDSISTGNYNSAAGVGTGLFLARGSNNTFMGYHAGSNTGNGNHNIAIGSNSGSGNAYIDSLFNYNITLGVSSGRNFESFASNNLIVGTMSGNSITRGSNNVFIGNNSGNNIIFGGSNIIVGNNINSIQDVSDSLNIGNIITSNNAYNATGNITFANSYTFPSTSGLAGQTLVLKDNDSLVWSNLLDDETEQNLTVSGASTDMQPFSRLVANSTWRQAVGLVHYIPVTAMSNGSITKLSTFITAPHTEDLLLSMGIYESYSAVSDTIAYEGINLATAEYKFKATDTISTGQFGYCTIDFYNGDYDATPGSDQRSFKVQAGKSYIIAVTIKALPGAIDGNPNVFYLRKTDVDIKGAKYNNAGQEIYDIDIIDVYNPGYELIWVRAH